MAPRKPIRTPGPIRLPRRIPPLVPRSSNPPAQATDIIERRSFNRVDDDPEGRYARVLDDTSFARAEQGPTVQSLRIGSSARVPLDVAGGPEQRTQGVVNLGRVPYVRSWRVTLGEPRIENEGVVAFQGGDVADVAYNVNPVLGLLEWGVQGASFNAEIDWGRGCSFVVSADYINVQVQCLNLVGTPSTPNPAVAIFPATIAPAEAGSPPTVVTRTIYSGVIAAGASAQIKIPPFAKRVKFQRVASGTPPENAEMTVFANAALTQVVAFDQMTAGGLTNGQQIYGIHQNLPPQGIVLQIRNGPGAVNPASWMAIFELEIG